MENNFDGLRLLSAFMVLISHQFALSGNWEPRFIGDHSFGNIGVLFFFSMSGYLVTISWNKDPKIWRFLFRRASRIAPGLIVSILLTYVMVTTLGIMGFPGNPLSSLNGSLWTIPLEVYCYLLLMTLGVIFKNPSLPFISGMFLLWWITGGQTTTVYLAYFGLFFGFGSLMSYYPMMRTTKMIIMYCIVGMVLLLINQTILALALIIPPVVINIGISSWPIIRNAGHYGDLSYGVYIYAWPTQQLFVHFLGKETNYFMLLIPSILVTFLLAYLSWNFIEKPTLYIKSTMLKKPKSLMLKTIHDNLSAFVQK